MVNERAGNSGLHWVYCMEAKVILNWLSSESLTGTQVCLPLDNFLFILSETMELFTDSHSFTKFLCMAEQILMLGFSESSTDFLLLLPQSLPPLLFTIWLLFLGPNNDPGNFLLKYLFWLFIIYEKVRLLKHHF